ncbi:MAG: proteasome subunit beta, partial [Nanoarchaeota archaeon]|nr:proteasome subunit beta [Nanoarchaeota archaeon]
MDTNMGEQLKTGTTTIGIMCKDGVVLAADKRATAGSMIVDKRAEKVHLLTDDFAVTIAGTVSDAQLLIKLSRAELK